MRALNLITLILVIVGAINWGLIGAFEFNLVTALFGVDSTLTRLVYILVGLSGIYQLIPLSRALASSDRAATTATR